MTEQIPRFWAISFDGFHFKEFSLSAAISLQLELEELGTVAGISLYSWKPELEAYTLVQRM